MSSIKDHTRFWKEVLPEPLDPYLPNVRNDGNVEILCPFHKEDTPSFSINIRTGHWHCKSPDCPSNQLGREKEGGDATHFLQYYFEIAQRPALDLKDYFAEGNSFKKVFPIPEEQIIAWEEALWGSQEMQEYLIEQRGFSVEVLKRLRIGYDRKQDRTTIPVYNSRGHVVNVRMHSRKRDGSGKVVSYTLPGGITSLGSPPRFWPMQEMVTWDDSKWWVATEGEMDCISAMSKGVTRAFTGTGGAGSFPRVADTYITHPELFSGKRIAVVYDSDEPGIKGGQNVAQTLLIRYQTKEVKTIVLPEEGTDLNLFFLKHPIKDFVDLIVSTEPTIKNPDILTGIAGGIGLPEQYPPADLDETAIDPSKIGSAFPREFLIKIAGAASSPLIIPRVVRWDCKHKADERKECRRCVFNFHNEPIARVMPAADTLLLATRKDRMQSLLREMRGIPANCTLPECRIESQYYVHAIQIESVEQDKIQQSSGMHIAYFFQKENDEFPRMGGQYDLRGWIDAHPGNESRIIIAAELSPTEDQVMNFQLNDDMAKRLDALYRLNPGQSVKDKLNDIHADQERNISRIYGRRLLHLAVDITMFSSLRFQWKGLEEKGRVDAIVVGDTGTAKTKVAATLMNHYGLGKILSGEAATFAGMVGGTQFIDGVGWINTWGQLPQNDLRMVCIDEMSGLSVQDINKMTSVRGEEGKVKITHIRQGEALARTRILWLSNPRRSDRGQTQLADERYGVNVLENLFGTAEDVRRLDFALMLTSDEIDMTDIEAVLTMFPPGEPAFDHASSRALLLWAWSRNLNSLDQVVFEGDAEHLLDVLSDTARTTYHPIVPLVSSDFSKKLARISIALAIRLFSHVEGDYNKVLVREGHVKAAWDFIQEVYAARSSGYLALSQARYAEERRAQLAYKEAMNWLRNFPRLYSLLRGGKVGTRVLEDVLGLDQDERAELLTFFTEADLLRPTASGYSYQTSAIMNRILDDYISENSGTKPK